MPRFAANLTMMLNEVPFLDRFRLAAQSGFDAVEFLFPYDHPADSIRAALDDNGLTLALFNLPPGDWARGDRGHAALPHAQAEFRDGLDKALAYAEQLSPANLHVMAGLAPAGDAGARSVYRDNLIRAANDAGERGIGIVIEPLNRRDMPGYFLDDFAAAAELIHEIGHPNLRLQFDIYHRQILHGDVTRGLETLLPITGHVQIASVPHRNEPGTGELDDFKLFELLDRLGYSGFVGCEYRPANGTIEGLGWLAEARRRSAFPGETISAMSG